MKGKSPSTARTASCSPKAANTRRWRGLSLGRTNGRKRLSFPDTPAGIAASIFLTRRGFFLTGGSEDGCRFRIPDALAVMRTRGYLHCARSLRDMAFCLPRRLRTRGLAHRENSYERTGFDHGRRGIHWIARGG